MAATLIARWNLDGNSNDPVGGFNGTDTSITYSAANGRMNQGAGFNGSSSKIQISTSSSSPMRQSSFLNYSFWAKIPSGGLARMGVAVNGGHGSGGILIGLSGASFNWTPSSPGSDRAWNCSFTLTADKWYHFVFSISFSGNSLSTWYVNAVPQTTTLNVNDVTNGVPATSYNNSNGDCIGARYVNSFSYGNASIDMVKIYNAALLTQDEINALYNEASNLGFFTRQF